MVPLLLALACTRPVDTGDGDLPDRILATDIGGRAWLEADLETGAVEARHPLSALEPEACPGTDDRYCLVFQARWRATWDGRHEFVLAWSPVDRSDGSSEDKGDMESRYAGVEARSGEVNWRLDALDLSAIPESGCPVDPDDPCTPAPDLSLREHRACTLYMAHDAQVIEEDEDAVRLWLADTQNDRLLRVRLERERTCAVVEEAIDGSYPDWYFYTSPNSLQHWRDDGAEYLLASVKGTRPIDAQQGGPSRGKVVLWSREDGAERWSQAWEHPAESTTEVSFLNSPHGAWMVGRDWDQRVVYAHTLGAGEDWMSEGRLTGGTVGMLRLDGDGYDYLYDATLPEGQALSLTRDVTPLADGSFLVTDSGCLSEPDCEHDTALWVLDLDGLEPGSGDGAWTPDQRRQDLREARVVAGPLLSDEAVVLYSAEVF